MAIDFSIDIKIPKIEIKTPSKDWWEAVGQEQVATIRKRTQVDGEDYQRKPFDAYSPSYRAQLLKAGKPKKANKPNLTVSGRMLGAMAKGIRAQKDNVTITLSGEDGGKAFENELRGRVFFAYNEKDAKKFLDDYDKWLDKNGLK